MTRTKTILAWVFAATGMTSSASLLSADILAIKGKTVYTMAGAAIEDGVVVIQDGKIAAVGKAADVAIPDGAQVLNAEVVTPGLIDAHSVVGLTGYLNQRQDQEQIDHSEPIQPELRALDAYDPQERLVEWIRGFGITTINTGHAPGEIISGQTMIVKTTGKTVDEAVVVPTAMIAATLGDWAVKGGGKAPGTRSKAVAMLREELVKAQIYLKKQQDAENSKAKTPESTEKPSDPSAPAANNSDPAMTPPAEMATTEKAEVASHPEATSQPVGEPADATPPTAGTHEPMKSEESDAKAEDKKKDPPDRDLRMEALCRVLKREIPLLVTVHRAADIVSTLRLAKEFGICIILDGASEAYLVREEIKTAGVPVILHPTMMRSGKGPTENASMETASILKKAGIPFAIQSGFEDYVPKTRIVLFEAGVAASNGLLPQDALASITIEAAKILGIQARVGSLEVGKDGDVAMYDGDPFEYTTHCTGAVINGKLVSDVRR